MYELFGALFSVFKTCSYGSIQKWNLLLIFHLPKLGWHFFLSLLGLQERSKLLR